MSVQTAHTIELRLPMHDGVQLFVRDWPLPSAHPSAPGVMIMHGLSEHCGRYLALARFFNALGYVVRTYDQRGHGQSGGPVGDIPEPDALMRDARTVLNDFRQQLQHPPLLFGHSMGGLFATRFVLEGWAPVRGLILSSPALALALSPWQERLLRWATRWIAHVALPNGLATRYLSHDEAVLSAYRRDPLIHPRISARLLNSMQDSMRYVHDHATLMSVPVLLLAAGEDHIVDVEGSRRFLARVPGEWISAHFFEGYYHEIFNEAHSAPVYACLRHWLDSTCPPLPR